VISIEAFPLITNTQVPDTKPGVTTASQGRGGDSFASVVNNLKSDTTPVRSGSGETSEVEGSRKNKNESSHLLGDPAANSQLVDVKKNIVSHPDTQASSQNGATPFPLGIGQHQSGEGQAGASYLKNSVAALLGNILSQLGGIQEDSVNATPIKELLMKMGLNADEAAQLLELNAGNGEEKKVFIAQLMSVLEGKGITAAQAQEISEMIVELQVKGDSLVSAAEKEAAQLKDLLVQMGMSPEEADKIVKDGELSLAAVKKIVAPLEINAEEVSKVVEGEKVALGDLKRVLLQLGVKPENLNALLAQSNSARSEVLPKGLLEALSSVINNSDGNSAGNRDVKGGGQFASTLNSDKAVAGVSQNQGNFEQVMSKIGPRGPVAQKVMEQVVEGARIQVANGQTRAKIVLQPPSLGKLNLHIITKNGQVKVTFFAENLQVKEIIESNLAQLRQSFVQQGLRVDDFGVFVGHHPSGNAAGQENAFGGLTADSPDLDGPDGEGSGSPEGIRSWIAGNHTVDLFV
jgi:flagellar hook-length control protein FliK